jgi:protein ImuA
MGKGEKLAVFRQILPSQGDRGPCQKLGHAKVDKVLGGGLLRGALHEIFAEGAGGPAIGFAAALALALAGRKPLFWIASDFAMLEYGGLCAGGFAELGGDPARLVLLRLSHLRDALKAAGDILSCPHVGALVIETIGASKSLDLTASRRLTLAANAHNVPALFLRLGAVPQPSAAETRWLIGPASSAPWLDWGAPRFAARLLRNRHGGLGQWEMEWDHDRTNFRAPGNAADHGALAAASTGGPAAAQRRTA